MGPQAYNFLRGLGSAGDEEKSRWKKWSINDYNIPLPSIIQLQRLNAGDWTYESGVVKTYLLVVLGAVAKNSVISVVNNETTKIVLAVNSLDEIVKCK